MNDLEKILKNKSVGNGNTNTIFNNNYDSAANEKDLTYIDKFLKVITNNHKVDILYDDVPTAFMDPKTGNITLPKYVMNDRDIYISMGSHEVSHVLHTPREFYDEHNRTQTGNVKIDSIDITPLFFYCINIVEDIRIEKIIRRKYPGFVEIYNRASKKIIDGLFKITEDKWNNEFTIADKVNVKAKCTNHLEFELTPFEDGVLRYLKKANTFNDVLVKSAYLYELMLDEKDTDEKDIKSSASITKQDKFDKLAKTIKEDDSVGEALKKVKSSLNTNREEELSDKELEDITDNIMERATNELERNSTKSTKRVILSRKTSKQINKSFMTPKKYLK